MARLAKEVGLVGGHRIDQMDHFVATGTFAQYEAAVILQLVELERAGTAAQPAFHHGLLCRHADAALVIDERRKVLERPRRDAVAGDRHHQWILGRSG
jgi:hypothetical protein